MYRRFVISFCALLSVSSAIAYFSHLIFILSLPLLFLFVASVLLIRISRKFRRFNNAPSSERSVALSPLYRSEQRRILIDELNDANHFRFEVEANMMHSFDVRWSALSSLNSVLSSIYDQSLLIQIPSKPIKLSLRNLEELLRGHIIDDDELNIRRFPRIKLEAQCVDNANELSLAHFEQMIGEMDSLCRYQRTYFVVECNKQPLFECGAGHLRSVSEWMQSDHYFCVIIGCYEAEDGTRYALIVDPNPDFGFSFVSMERMHEAVRWKNCEGKAGGLLKIQAHFIL